MKWTKEFQQDVLEWDTVNWRRAVDFWDVASICQGKSLRVLDVGARSGGLSLLFGCAGQEGIADYTSIVCSDLSNPSETAGPLHQKYGLESRVSYAVVNAVELEAVEEYDVVCFKSVLGGIGYGDNKAAQEAAVRNMYRALRPGGYLVFAENLAATRVHQFLRKKFNRWNSWRYITIAEVQAFCSDFSDVRWRCFGFLGTLGRSERQRRFLGRIDQIFDCLLPDNAKYIISVVAKK